VTSQVLVLGDEALQDVWRTVERMGWLAASDTIRVWHSRRAQKVRTPDDWVDARLDFSSGMKIISPFFAGGTPLPDLWLRSGRLVVICELRPDPVWQFRGAMAAQAEPLVIGCRLPGFRTALALCEAQRVGAADLVLMRALTRQGPRWLVGQSALELDRLVARAAGLNPRAVPHLALWQRHFLNPPDVEPAEPFEIRLPPARAGLASHVASGLCAAADAGADVARGWANRHRIPTFLRKRLVRASS
jgi:hypothetical protein